MSILQCFICVIPNGIHQGWIPASAGMTEGFTVLAQALNPVFQGETEVGKTGFICRYKNC
jgi:hypothetical protein